jgi:hypothetical protein
VEQALQTHTEVQRDAHALAARTPQLPHHRSDNGNKYEGNDEGRTVWEAMPRASV